MTLWRNWCGLESTAPDEVLTPTDTAEISAAVHRARESGGTVKMVGTGHSFTGISAPEGVRLDPFGLSGITEVDHESLTVTALAGTPLKVFNAELERLGLSLHNMGDIAEQTLAGAISTGTHGTGGVAAGLAAQVVGLELVTGTGEVIRCSAVERPDIFGLARIGLGALGVLTRITFSVEPLFVLEAHERLASWAGVVGGYDALIAEHHHCDIYWFPGTDRMHVKANDRLDATPGEATPLPRWRQRFDDDLVSNGAFGALNRLVNTAPALTRPVARLSTRALSERRYSDVAHRVFTSPRRVRFKEMEYAVPAEAGIPALVEARRVIERAGFQNLFPVEVRYARADDVAMSTAYQRDSVYLAFHTHVDADHRAYFAAVEEVLRAHEGRPHWGKLHQLAAADLAQVHPRFDDFTALRDQLDPDRVFANTYLRRVLG
ncbi:D-arabinono-1,4-lactone oxidase [Nocardioides limicola]|uniref:D-arabinono-1,4-lactone oxidase n=1 Tax=Nocardioides limicola TaxID=2803368 RepID=UPI00193B33F8|nr:D-arabinono-1,4-lactone oxidase [Nocardioides sp. DJM-14]